MASASSATGGSLRVQTSSTRSRADVDPATTAGYGATGPATSLAMDNPRLLGWSRRRPVPTVPVMITLHIEHPVSDLTTWRAAFDQFAERRRQGGVCAEWVRHPVDDDHYVLVDLDFATREQAQRFLDFLETTVWASRDSSPALAGTPRTRVLEPA